MNTVNLYWYHDRVCLLHTKCGTAAIVIPPVGMYVEFPRGEVFVVKKVTYMPAQDRYDVELGV